MKNHSKTFTQVSKQVSKLPLSTHPVLTPAAQLRFSKYHFTQRSRPSSCMVVGAQSSTRRAFAIFAQVAGTSARWAGSYWISARFPTRLSIRAMVSAMDTGRSEPRLMTS